MSGGRFDYKQYQIKEIAEEIEQVVAENDRDFPPEIIERFKEAAHTLHRAAEMAQRVDWLLSGDDGEECFMERWDEEVRPPWN